MKPARLLNLEDASKHLTLRQFGVALFITAASALFWGAVTKSKFVGLLVFGTQLVTIWNTPSAKERVWPRVGAMFLWGAICAGAWQVLKLMTWVRSG